MIRCYSHLGSSFGISRFLTHEKGRKRRGGLSLKVLARMCWRMPLLCRISELDQNIFWVAHVSRQARSAYDTRDRLRAGASVYFRRVRTLIIFRTVGQTRPPRCVIDFRQLIYACIAPHQRAWCWGPKTSGAVTQQPSSGVGPDLPKKDFKVTVTSGYCWDYLSARAPAA